MKLTYIFLKRWSRFFVFCFLTIVICSCASTARLPSDADLPTTSIVQQGTPTKAAPLSITSTPSAGRCILLFARDGDLYVTDVYSLSTKIRVPGIFANAGPEGGLNRLLIGHPPSMTSDGDYFVVAGIQSTIVVDSKDGNYHELANQRVSTSLNPVESSLAYIDENGLIVTQPPFDQGGRLIFANRNLDSRYIQWAPDGKTIGFLERLSDDQALLQTFDTETQRLKTLTQLSYPIQGGVNSLQWSEEGRFLSVFTVTAELSTGLVTSNTQLLPPLSSDIEAPAGNRNSIRPLVNATMQKFETVQVDDVHSSVYVTTLGKSGYKKIATVPLVGGLALGGWSDSRELIVSGLRSDTAMQEMLLVNIVDGTFKSLETNAYLVASFPSCQTQK